MVAFPSSFLSLSAILFVASCSLDQVEAQTGLAGFTQQGFPTIGVIGITLLAVLALLVGLKAGSLSGLTHHLLFTILNCYVWVSGFFLIFGPDLGFTNFARAAIIGLTLGFNGAIGFYAAITNSPYTFLAYVVVAVYNILALLGSLQWLSHNSPIWILDTGQCNTYFLTITPIDRCVDDGFLQFLRVIGTSVIMILAITASQAFLVWVDPEAYGRTSVVGKAGVGGLSRASAAQPQLANGPVYANAPVYANGPAPQQYNTNSRGPEGQGLIVQAAPGQPIYTTPVH